MSTVRREIVLPVERERAWALLTEPGELREWLADEVELEPEEGAPLRVAWATGETREGVVEEVEERAPAALPLGRRRDRRPVARRVDARRRTRRHARRRRGAPARAARGARRAAALAPARDRDDGAGARGRAGVRVRVDVDAVFAALADPTRRAVIGRLAQEPLSASGSPASCRSAARRSPSTSPRSTARASSRRAAAAARRATRSTPSRWARRWPGWPPSARSGTSASRGWPSAAAPG